MKTYIIEIGTKVCRYSLNHLAGEWIVSTKQAVLTESDVRTVEEVRKFLTTELGKTYSKPSSHYFWFYVPNKKYPLFCVNKQDVIVRK